MCIRLGPFVPPVEPVMEYPLPPEARHTRELSLSSAFPHSCFARVNIIAKRPQGETMTPEHTSTWLAHRRMIVVSQMAPTALLITTVALLQFGLAETSFALRVATAGILLASGILGALVQFTSATEAEALSQSSPSEKSISSWLWVVKYVTPAIFVVIYVALMVALFG